MAELTVRVEAEHGYAVVQAGPRITRACIGKLRRALDKALRAQGKALVDLTGTGHVEPIWAAVFPAALADAGGWPHAKLALYGVGEPLAGLLRRTRIDELVPAWATEADAAAGIERRPPRVRHAVLLGPGPFAPATARRTVESACLAWGLPARVREDAVLVTSELVTNAVRYAGTDVRLSLECGRRRLVLGARDFATGSRPWPAAAGGLTVVAKLTSHWGVLPHEDGKTVWARLRIA